MTKKAKLEDFAIHLAFPDAENHKYALSTLAEMAGELADHLGSEMERTANISVGNIEREFPKLNARGTSIGLAAAALQRIVLELGMVMGNEGVPLSLATTIADKLHEGFLLGYTNHEEGYIKPTKGEIN